MAEMLVASASLAYSDELSKDFRAIRLLGHRGLLLPLQEVWLRAWIE